MIARIFRAALLTGDQVQPPALCGAVICRDPDQNGVEFI
jgi:hypothetical protein